MKFNDEVQVEKYHPDHVIRRTKVTDDSNKNKTTKSTVCDCDETATKDGASKKDSTSEKTLDVMIQDEGLSESGTLAVKIDSKTNKISITATSTFKEASDVAENEANARNGLKNELVTEIIAREKNLEDITFNRDSNLQYKQIGEAHSEKIAEKEESAQNFEGFWNSKIAEDTYDLMAGKNKRKQPKKRFDMISTLPAIKEEPTSQKRDVTMMHDVINNGDVMNSSRMDGDKQKTREKATVVATSDRNVKTQRQELLRQTREKARLSALRGQLAAERAALNCVIRYPRYARSNWVNSSVQLGNRRYNSSEMINGLNQKELKNNFLFHGGEKLDIYKPSFMDRNRDLRTLLPPLSTSSASDVTLVSRRNSGVWVPDLSVVTGGQRKKLKPHSRFNTTRT